MLFVPVLYLFLCYIIMVLYVQATQYSLYQHVIVFGFTDREAYEDVSVEEIELAFDVANLIKLEEKR